MFELIRMNIAFFFLNWKCTWWLGMLFITSEEAREIEVTLVKELIKKNKEDKK